MKAIKAISAVLAGLMISGAAMAGDARTSAEASNGLLRDGSATATAQYQGKAGFAQTASHSGRVNTARGVAVGVDKQGMTLSVSNAVAPKIGPAVAVNFNIGIDRDGDVTKSRSIVVAKGPLLKKVSAGGEVHNGRRDDSTRSFAGGKALLGHVRVASKSDSR
ncbi:MAG: hypothetical protein IT450_10830 [Phycisphaerales bacterium]|nr:hypothetical protein [Phycisphaerales bacterium]